MADYVPLIVSVLVAGATVATVAILLRTPVRLTDTRCRLAELEARVAGCEASAKKALRWAKAERKAEQAEADAEADLPLFPGQGAPAPATNRMPTLADVKREIIARKRGF